MGYAITVKSAFSLMAVVRVMGPLLRRLGRRLTTAKFFVRKSLTVKLWTGQSVVIRRVPLGTSRH